MSYKRTPPDRTKADDMRCKTCLWHGVLDGIICCEYLLCTGRRRGCPAGVGCTRYQQGNNKRQPTALEDPDILDIKPRSDNWDGLPLSQRGHPGNPHQADLDAYRALRAAHPLAEISRSTGYSVSGIKLIGKKGTVSTNMARVIRETYGVELIKQKR